MLLLDGTILNTSLPTMATRLGVPALALSAAVTVYLLAGAAVLPLASWLADRFGPRRVFLGSIAVFTGASLACGLAHDATQLVLARALQGLGGGLMMPVGRTLAMRDVRKEDLMQVTSLLIWPALFAPVLGPPLGGLITTYASWRWNFLLNVPLGMLAVVLILRWVPADRRGDARPLDVAGALGAAGGLILLLGGLQWMAHVVRSGEGSLRASLVLAMGIGMLAWTTRHLGRARHPVLSLGPLAHRTFRVATVTGGTFAAMCLQGTPFLLPLMFQLALGRSAVDAGALLLPYFLGNLAMKSVTTPILRRFGFRRVLVGAGAVNAGAIAAFALVAPQTAWSVLVLLLAAAGCARSMLLTAQNTLMFADVTPAERGAASALGTLSMQVASALGVAVGAILLGLAQGVRGGTHLELPDFQCTFAALGVICALATLSFRSLSPDAGAGMTETAPGSAR